MTWPLNSSCSGKREQNRYMEKFLLIGSENFAIEFEGRGNIHTPNYVKIESTYFRIDFMHSQHPNNTRRTVENWKLRKWGINNLFGHSVASQSMWWYALRELALNSWNTEVSIQDHLVVSSVTRAKYLISTGILSASSKCSQSWTWS